MCINFAFERTWKMSDVLKRLIFNSTTNKHSGEEKEKLIKCSFAGHIK